MDQRSAVDSAGRVDFLTRGAARRRRGAITVSLTAQIFFEGLKAGLLTFGGAFTVIPFLRESAVEGHHWLRPGSSTTASR